MTTEYGIICDILNTQQFSQLQKQLDDKTTENAKLQAILIDIKNKNLES